MPVKVEQKRLLKTAKSHTPTAIMKIKLKMERCKSMPGQSWRYLSMWSIEPWEEKTIETHRLQVFYSGLFNNTFAQTKSFQSVSENTSAFRTLCIPEQISRCFPQYWISKVLTTSIITTFGLL